jgi:AcrR family transcriptional regulator
MKPTRVAQHSAEVRAHILETAGEVFAERGFGGAGVDEIARRAGVNKAMLYYHVGDKAALFGETVTANLSRIHAAVAAAVAAHTDPRERFKAIPRAFVATVREHPYLPQLMLREIAAGGPNLPAAALAEMAEVMRLTAATLDDGARRRAFRRVDPFVTHLMLVGALMFMANSVRLKDRFANKLPIPAAAAGGLESLSDTMVAIALDGIAVKKA